MKKIVFALLALVLLLAGVVLFRTFTFKSIHYAVKATPAPAVTPEALQHFQEAIRFQTISYADSTRLDSAQFNGFHRFLAQTYPGVHRALQRQVFKNYSLLYTWPGKDPSLKPYILMAHQDVVPIEEASRQLWTVEPFGGEVKENYIWGRGATDDKINLISIMEAAEKLVAENYQPDRTIYLVFGHDEEVGGKGAIAMAAWFKAAGIEAELVLDEGGIITREKIPGISQPVALIGNAEKGYLSVEVAAEKSGGHSSMPEPETAIDILTTALQKLRAEPFEARFSEPMEGLIASLGPEMPFAQKMAFANTWLFKGAIVGTYEQSGPGNAMIRTTLVPTILQSGIKDNVVPTIAKATINLRLLPGDQSDAVMRRLQEMVADERVKFRKLTPLAEASPVTAMTSEGFKKVEATIKQSLPGTLSSPFLVIGATDSRHFHEVSPHVLKFSPMIDPIGFHGIDERVSLESYQTAIWFFENLMRNAR
jgi:carboxypeptidase PM20D1